MTTTVGFCTIHPYVKIVDESEAVPLMEEFVEATKSEEGCVFYGWTRCGDRILCREGYTDAAAVSHHLKNVGKLLDAILNGPATMEKLEVHGPAEELEKLKPELDPLGCVYYSTWNGFSNLKALTSTAETPYTHCSIHPYFTIQKPDKFFDKVAQGMIDGTKDKEPGCLWYAWMVIGKDKLFCREAYKDGAAVVAHLNNVGGTLGGLIEEGVLKVDTVEIHAPQSQIDIIKPTGDKFKAVYYATLSGFEKFQGPSSSCSIL